MKQERRDAIRRELEELADDSWEQHELDLLEEERLADELGWGCEEYRVEHYKAPPYTPEEMKFFEDESINFIIRVRGPFQAGSPILIPGWMKDSITPA